MVVSLYFLVLKKQHVSNGCKLYLSRSPARPNLFGVEGLESYFDDILVNVGVLFRVPRVCVSTEKQKENRHLSGHTHMEACPLAKVGTLRMSNLDLEMVRGLTAPKKVKDPRKALESQKSGVFFLRVPLFGGHKGKPSGQPLFEGSL